MNERQCPCALKKIDQGTGVTRNTFLSQKPEMLPGSKSPSLRIGGLIGRSRVSSVRQRSCVFIGKGRNVVGRAVLGLEIVGDLGGGAGGAGLDAALGGRDEAVAGTGVWAVCQALEVCVVSGGQGLLEATSSAVVALDLNVPFRQDAEEAQRVDEGTAAWGDAACLVRCVSHRSGIDVSSTTYVGVPIGADPAITGTIGARVEANVES